MRILTILGHEERAISHYLDISRPTLRKHYRKELRSARTQLTMNAMAVVVQAMSDTRNDIRDRVGAAMWVLRCFAGLDGRGGDVNLNLNVNRNADHTSVLQAKAVDVNEAARTYLELMAESKQQLRVISGGKK